MGRGKSFRENHPLNLISHGMRSFNVYGRKIDDQRRVQIGVEYSRGGFKAHLDGAPVLRLSQLAEQTPIQIIAPNTLEIVEKGSMGRRSLIDWGVFHVEHEFGKISSRYRRVLSQRNADIRNNVTSRASSIWIPELVSLGNQIDTARCRYTDLLKIRFQQYSKLLGMEQIPSLELFKGWSSKHSLEESLKLSAEQDKKRGFVSVGPHRADLLFKDEQGLLKKWGSRGQIKMSLIALSLAQVDLLFELRQKRSVLLLDDLPSELDEESLANVYAVLCNSKHQVFITTVDKSRFSKLHRGGWFHVEHGAIAEVCV